MTTTPKPPRFKHSPENDAMILDLFQAGKTDRQIGRAVKGSVFAVQAARHRMGLHREGPGAEAERCRPDRPEHWPKSPEPGPEAVRPAVDVADLEHGERLIATGAVYRGSIAEAQIGLRRVQRRIAEREAAK